MNATSEAKVLRVLVTTAVISKAADYSLMLVIPLAVLHVSGSVAGAIFTFALRGLAYAASPLAGSIIDRFDRRTVFVSAQLQQAACIACAALFLRTPALVGLFLLLSGLGGVATSITGQFVLIPALVQSDRRPKAAASLASAIEFAKVAGFLASGVTTSVFHAETAAWLVAALYLCAAVVGTRLPSVSVERAPRKLMSDLRLGFSWLAKPDVGWLVASMAISNLAVGGLETVLVTVTGSSGASPAFVSMALACGLLMGAFGARLSPRVLNRRVLGVRVLVFQVLAGLALLLISIDGEVWFRFGAYGALAFALGLSNVASISYRQDSIPVELAGRVNSVIRMFIAGAIPLSGMIYSFTESRGLWIWLPALVLQSAAVSVWAMYVVRSGAAAKRGAIPA